MKKIQIFGQNELIKHINNGGNINSHLISIGNPKHFYNKNKEDTKIPEIFNKNFKKILRLNFYDLGDKSFLQKNQKKRIPESSDIKKIIKFYNNTKNEATGYTIHCWAGVSRSTAVALCLLYLMTNSEEKSKQILQKIRPQTMPIKRILILFDNIIGSNLSNIKDEIQNDFVNKLKKELNFDDNLEELEPIDESFLLQVRDELK